MKRKDCFRFLTALALLIFTAGEGLAQSMSVLTEPEHTPATAERGSAYTRLIDPATGMTADELVRYALEHNGELHAARKMIAEARGRLRQAGLKPNPTLEVSGMQAVTGPDNNMRSEEHTSELQSLR